MNLEVVVPYLTVFVTALIVTVATVPLARAVAIRLKAIDYPSARRINKVPVPRMGGIAMLLGLAAALVVQYFGTLAFDWPSAFISHPSLNINYWGIALSVLVIFITGIIDDVVSLRPWQKLLGQIIAGSVAAASGLLIGHIVNPFGEGALYLGWIAYPITVLYLVCFANIINLIDGLDGLAAGLSAIVSMALFCITFAAGRVDAAALAVAICGVCVGFLRYNSNPASIFMGDSGALMLGFLLGTVSLLGVRRVAALTTLIVPLVIAGVPIIDTFAAIIRRKRGHVSIGTADKGHIQHRLIAGGYNQRQAALLIYGWSALLAVSAVVITQVEPGWRVVILVVLVVVSAAFIMRLHLFEPVLYHRTKTPARRNRGTRTPASTFPTPVPGAPAQTGAETPDEDAKPR
ncbi:MAG: MraY family glycosyltransferase [Coriobacteriales bacterium]